MLSRAKPRVEDGGIDVAILAAPTSTAREMLRSIAKACTDQGLRVEILVPAVGAFYEGVPAMYRDLGLSLRAMDLRGLTSPGWGYPRPIGLVALLPRLLRILDGVQPRCVVTHIDSQDMWRAIHWWARLRGVPGLVVQEGSTPELKCGVADPEREWGVSARYRLQMSVLRAVLPGLFRFAPLNMYADNVCAWGQVMERRLVGLGRRPSTITVTGNPRFDDFHQRRPLPDRTIATVLFAHQHQFLVERELEFCRTLVDVCANRIKCRLLFRPHPRSRLWGEGVHGLVSDVAGGSGYVAVAEEGELNDYLGAASVFLTFYSTSAYDAVVHGVPLVLSDWCSPNYRLDAARYGAAIDVESPSDLEGALRRALFNDDVRQQLYRGGDRLIADHLYALDGRASWRVARTIVSLLDHPGASNGE